MKATPGTKIGRVMGTFIVATTMIGSGVYMLPATVATYGSISAVGWLIAAFGAVLTGLTLAALARVAPGGCFLYSIARQLGTFAGLVATMLYLLSSAISVPMVAVATAGYVSFIVPALGGQQNILLVTIAFIWVFTLLSWRGAAVIARVGSLTLMIGLLPLLLVGTVGWLHFDQTIFRAGWNVSGTSDLTAALHAAMLLFMAYLGLENASIISDQMRDPNRDVPIATIAGILFATLIYLASTTAISGLIPVAALAHSAAPFADATAIMLGSASALLVAVCGASKAAGTLGAVQLGTAESLLILKRQAVGGQLSRGIANLGIGVFATVLALATSAPTIAVQFGVLVSALVSLCLLSFALAGVALARARGGVQRLVGLGCTAFSVGILASQSARDLQVAMVLLALASIAALLLRHRQRRVQAALV